MWYLAVVQFLLMVCLGYVIANDAFERWSDLFCLAAITVAMVILVRESHQSLLGRAELAAMQCTLGAALRCLSPFNAKAQTDLLRKLVVGAGAIIAAELFVALLAGLR